jgi:hypothetical protein
MINSETTTTTGGADSDPLLEDPSREQELQERIDSTLKSFDGDIDMLEKAFGMLMLGDYVGWRVLVLVHSKSTLRRYEQILGIKVREFFPEEGPLSRHSQGYNRALELHRYWKVANGDIAVEHRRLLRPPPGRDDRHGSPPDEHDDGDPESFRH